MGFWPNLSFMATRTCETCSAVIKANATSCPVCVVRSRPSGVPVNLELRPSVPATTAGQSETAARGSLAASKQIAQATHVAAAIDTTKWVLVWLIMGSGILAALGILTVADGGALDRLVGAIGVLLFFAILALITWIQLGWAQHLLRMLILIAMGRGSVTSN